MGRDKSELDKFEAAINEVLAVSHEEIKKRENVWKQDRLKKKKKRTKTSPASRAANDRV